MFCVSLCLSWWKRGHAFRRTDQFIYSIFFSLVFNMVILLMRLQSKCSGVLKSTNSLILGARTISLLLRLLLSQLLLTNEATFSQLNAVLMLYQHNERREFYEIKAKRKRKRERGGKKLSWPSSCFYVFIFFIFFAHCLAIPYKAHEEQQSRTPFH